MYVYVYVTALEEVCPDGECSARGVYARAQAAQPAAETDAANADAERSFLCPGM
jgi:hypothetical protein